MERTRLVLVVVLVAFLVASASFFGPKFWRPNDASGGGNGPVGVAFDVNHIRGTPEMNTTDFWVARIKNVSTNERLASYQATLLRNGSVLVEAVTITPGQLGNSTHPIFEFFDSGTYCYPTPCLPPEGPDGHLSVDDYFRISFPDPGTAYTARVIWAASGDVVGEIVIET